MLLQKLQPVEAAKILQVTDQSRNADRLLSIETIFNRESAGSKLRSSILLGCYTTTHSSSIFAP
jgi:hypothetical protein